MRGASCLLVGALVNGVAKSAWGEPGLPPIRAAAVAPEGTAFARSCAEPFAAAATRRSQGRLRVRPVLGAVLGDEASQLALLRRGGIEVAGSTVATLAEVVPELHAFDLPYLMNDDDAVDRVLGAAPVRDALRRLLDRAGLVLIGLLDVGARHMAGKRPLRHPDDIRGLDVRSQESRLHLEMWRLLGAKARGIPVTETLTFLDVGRIQALDQFPSFLFATSWYQHFSHYTLTGHVHQLGAIVANANRLGAYPAGTRRLLGDAWGEVEGPCTRAVREENAEVLQALGRERVTVVALTTAERDEYRRRLAPARDYYRKTSSADGRRLLELLEAAIERERSRR